MLGVKSAAQGKILIEKYSLLSGVLLPTFVAYMEPRRYTRRKPSDLAFDKIDLTASSGPAEYSYTLLWATSLT